MSQLVLHLINIGLFFFFDIFLLLSYLKYRGGFPGGSEVKASACNAGVLGSILGSGRSPGERNGNPLQYSCLEKPMDRGPWWATVHRVTKSQTRLSKLTFTLTFQYSCLENPMNEGNW